MLNNRLETVSSHYEILFQFLQRLAPMPGARGAVCYEGSLALFSGGAQTAAYPLQWDGLFMPASWANQTQFTKLVTHSLFVIILPS